MLTALVAFAVFALAAFSNSMDVALTRAVVGGDGHRVGMLSIGTWLATTVALVSFVELGIVVLAFEGAGLYVGARLAMR